MQDDRREESGDNGWLEAVVDLLGGLIELLGELGSG
jgi:hypothetical protein